MCALRGLSASFQLGCRYLPGVDAGAGQDRQIEPGKFDFYVLSLSWSPSFCAAAARAYARQRQACNAARGPIRLSCTGCGRNTRSGFPENCQVPSPRLYRGIVSSMLDLMPAPRLIYNEWDRHGTCSGLSPRAYFDTMRKARAAVKIPPEYVDLQAAADRHAGRGAKRHSSKPIPDCRATPSRSTATAGG